MFFKTSNRRLLQKLQRLVPQIQQIMCAKVVNFITMDISSIDESWKSSQRLLNNQHIESLAYLQSNFKNHIVTSKDIENIKAISKYLKQSENNDLLHHLWETQSKISDLYRKNFYVFDKNMTIQQIMQCELMKNKAFNKIVCFSKKQPLRINANFQKFCLSHNVRALGLSQFSIRSLISQVSKTSKNPILIHEFPEKDKRLYLDESGKNVPTEIIVFLNKTNESKLNRAGYPKFKQIFKYYINRPTFNQLSQPATQGFTIFRLQHFTDFQKFYASINQHAKAIDPMEDEED